MNRIVAAISAAPLIFSIPLPVDSPDPHDRVPRRSGKPDSAYSTLSPVEAALIAAAWSTSTISITSGCLLASREKSMNFLRLARFSSDGQSSGGASSSFEDGFFETMPTSRSAFGGSASYTQAAIKGGASSSGRTSITFPNASRSGRPLQPNHRETLVALTPARRASSFCGHPVDASTSWRRWLNRIMCRIIQVRRSPPQPVSLLDAILR